MYSLPYFKEKDAAVVLQFMKDNPFVFLCGVDKDNKPVASQVPVFIDERDEKIFLTGHIMRSTDHHKAFDQNKNVLAVFTGAHTYVSAGWYSDPQQASTWNYMSVHAKGDIRFLGFEELLSVLKRTTNHFENNPHSPANFEQLPEEYVHHLAKAIVAFEIEVTEMDNVFKLSQNRDEKSYHHIMEQLKAQGNDGEVIAREMKKREEQLFNKL
jgi:transcriptional regulator